MSQISDALAALKTTITGVDASPQPALEGVWNYPTDYSSIDFSSLPVAIVSQVINRDRQFGNLLTGTSRHVWEAEILLFLEEGPLTSPAQMATAEAQVDDWIEPIGLALHADQSLGGTANQIGSAEERLLFNYRVGHIHWEARVFFGLRAVVRIHQFAAQPYG